MTIEWSIEIKAILFSLLNNPITYWVVFQSVIIAKRRRAREIIQFNHRTNSYLAEWKKTFSLSVLFAILISCLTLGFGLILTYEVILILCIITFLFSYVYHFTFLSISFTLGSTYLLLFKSIQNHYDDSIIIFTSITVLIGLFLLIEALLLYMVKNEDAFPELSLTKRGATFGQFHLNKISWLPFLVFVPSGPFTAFFPFLPEVIIDGSGYSIIIAPFFIGFSLLVQNKLPEDVAKRSAKRIAALGVIVIGLSIAAFYLPSLSISIVIIAFIGRTIIQIFSDEWGKKSSLQFASTSPGVTVLWVMDDSPAIQTGLEIGDTILKVNGVEIDRATTFYALLNDQQIVYTLEIIGTDNLSKTMQAILVTPHESELGLVLI